MICIDRYFKNCAAAGRSLASLGMTWGVTKNIWLFYFQTNQGGMNVWNGYSQKSYPSLFKRASFCASMILMSLCRGVSVKPATLAV